MRGRDFLRGVTVDHSAALDRFLAILDEARVKWCLVGRLAVNAYVDPVVTLDMDLVVAAGAGDRLVQLAQERSFASRFRTA